VDSESRSPEESPNTNASPAPKTNQDTAQPIDSRIARGSSVAVSIRLPLRRSRTISRASRYVDFVSCTLTTMASATAAVAAEAKNATSRISRTAPSRSSAPLRARRLCDSTGTRSNPNDGATSRFGW
jgi:hypothetical protein